MFADSIIQKMRDHAAAEYPKESCGFVVKNKYRPMKNISDTPEETFRIRPSDYVKASNQGIQAVVHSHPKGELQPSLNDMVSQINTAVPWVIVPKDGEVFWFGDGTPTVPLIGRAFRFGVQDCITAARDWYRENMDLAIPDCPRRQDWWVEEPDRLVVEWQNRGFHVVTGEPQIGDLLIISIGKAPLSHCAVYSTPGKMYHHPADRRSVEEFIDRWERYIVVRMRYKA